jgi:hypothetical protein
VVQIAVHICALIDCQNAALAMTQIAVNERQIPRFEQRARRRTIVDRQTRA